MNLNETQKKKVAEWVAQGMKLSEIQNRIASELQVRMTYMDVRFLVDDLKLTLKDPEPPKPAETLNANPAQTANTPPPANPQTQPSETLNPTGAVSVSVDQLARPGAMVSGKVTFSDGNKAEWYLDQTGRIGLSAQQAGYRPSAADLQQFQAALESELMKAGF
ncbi:MAG TPA: hypothetical protein VFM25_05795 [Verrucomicrobiae bacterium]|nr:hypothetical protein [Verrucomicrobiae bacterium]